MNERIRELISQATIPVIETNDYNGMAYETYQFNQELFAQLIVEECINEMITQMWKYGIDESNNPRFYKAIDKTKVHFGVNE